ncbi:hypothetical protein E3U26_04210 [Paracoccus ferrooxidans]|nr:hypothetical protein E3U26_04210 [Paracoccus ferrooxidans]
MKIILEGIGPDISSVREHIDPGLRRTRFYVETKDPQLSDGHGSAELTIIVRLGDTTTLRDAEALARQSAVQFLRRAAEVIDGEDIS